MDIEDARRRLAAHPRKGDPTAAPGETLEEKAERLGNAQGTHFWLMVVEDERGRDKYTGSGHITPPQGATRYDMRDLIRAQLEAQHPQARSGALVAFDIQPNQL